MKRAEVLRRALYWEDVREGQELPVLVKEVTATTIIAGALASRDYQPVHHDRAFAQSQGARDIFMNILTSSGWVGHYLTDWTGPEGELKKISLRLHTQCYPGATLTWTGRVAGKRVEGDAHLVDVEYVGKVAEGNHCVGTATLALPTRQ